MKSLRLLALLAPLAGFAAPLVDPPPNFIVILAEAQGWANTSTPMDAADSTSRSQNLKTPAIERLAREGMRFARGYAASPRCTPSRAALLTGKTPGALHMTYVGVGRRDQSTAEQRVLTPTPLLELPTEETTIAELLKDVGYLTAHFGKWHLGRVDPARHGFDASDGPTNNGGPDNVAVPNPKQAEGMTDRGIAFMEHAIQTGRPFYLQLSHYPDQETKGGGKRRDPQSESDLVDRTVARLLEAVDRLGLAGRTYIFYTADHGAQGRHGNEPLAGGKGSLSEGGLRVPFLVRGPGVAAGACARTPVTACDILPTLAELAGFHGPTPPGLEGGSLAALLHDPEGRTSVHRPREEIVFHFPHYDLGNGGPASALMLGSVKLIRNYATGTRRLYDLDRDPSESRDIAAERQTEATVLDAKLTAYLTSIHAELPRSNPAFTTEKAINHE